VAEPEKWWGEEAEVPPDENERGEGLGTEGGTRGEVVFETGVREALEARVDRRPMICRRRLSRVCEAASGD
jgi:hypothetical protein